MDVHLLLGCFCVFSTDPVLSLQIYTLSILFPLDAARQCKFSKKSPEVHSARVPQHPPHHLRPTANPPHHLRLTANPTHHLTSNPQSSTTPLSYPHHPLQHPHSTLSPPPQTPNLTLPNPASHHTAAPPLTPPQTPLALSNDNLHSTSSAPASAPPSTPTPRRYHPSGAAPRGAGWWRRLRRACRRLGRCEGPGWRACAAGWWRWWGGGRTGSWGGVAWRGGGKAEGEGEGGSVKAAKWW